MTTVHIDLRQLSGDATDEPLEDVAWISFAPVYMVHVEDGDDYLLTLNELEVKIIDGVATVDLPPTEVGNAMIARENKFEGARVKYLLIPDQSDVDYGDLEELDPETFGPAATPEPAWWAELDQQVVGGEVIGDDLWLERRNLTTFNAGDVRGPIGPPGTGGTFIDVESYGATGDGTTDDTADIQDAIDAVEAMGGGVIMFHQGKTYRAGGLILKSGVVLNGGGAGVKWAAGYSSVTIVPPTGWAGGWVIDTPAPATPIQAAGVIGFLISGGMNDASDPDTGGIRIQNGIWCTIDSCGVAGVSLGAVYVNGTANIIRNNGLQNFWQYRATQPTTDEGTLTVIGTDAWIESNQCNGGMPLTDNVASATNVDDLHRCGALLEVLTSWVIGGNCEFSEVGWKISAYESTLLSIRGDTNIGPGLYVFPSSFQGYSGGSLYKNIMLLANCLAPNATEALDAMYVNEYSTIFDGILLGPDWTASGNKPRYGINDFTTYTGFNGRFMIQYASRYKNIRSQLGAWTWDEMKASSLLKLDHRDGGAGNPTQRPPSRFATGKTWWDTVGNKLTISDGTNWRDTANAIVGSILSPGLAYASDGTTRWEPYLSRSTVAKILNTRFARNVTFEMTTTSTGATAGECDMKMMDAHAVAVVAGDTYQVAAYASGPVGKSPKMGISVAWYNGGTFLSTTVAVADTTAIAGLTSNPTLLLSAGIAAPATATLAVIYIIGKATSLAAGDKFNVGGFSLVKGSAMTDVIEP